MYLVGLTEISELLHLSRQRVDQIVRSDPSFPAPVAELRAGRVWKGDEIERWARRSGRLE